MEEEARTVSTKIDALEAEVKKEKASSMEISVKCRQLEDELSRKKLEAELQQTASANGQIMRIKQEDLDVAADKLAECDKTIASLGNQLNSLATLEDFLLDINLPKLSTRDSPISRTSEPWKLCSRETYSPAQAASDSSRITIDSSGPSANKIEGNSPESSSSFISTVPMNHVSSDKNRN